MKIRMLLLATMFLPAFVFGVEVSGLKCEYLENPQGIDIVKPRLSWKLEVKSQGAGSRGQKQTAYQILVASSEKLLAKEKGDLWDSGKVKSGQSVHVAYAGKPLASRTRCFWKVKIWDVDKKESPWSKSAQWTIGLLKPEDWSAKWISIDRAGAPLDSHNSPMLRKVFGISKSVKAAQVSICGLGYYEMFLNGSKVGDHVLDPSWTSYHKNALYVTYDISESLNKGQNAIGVQLANGVYNQEFGDAWDFDKAPWRAFPQMLLQLDVVYADGTKERIVSDKSWKASTGPITWDQLRMGVFYDARLEQPGWNTVDFDDTAWSPAIIREGAKGKLAAQMSVPIKVMKTLEPVQIDFKEEDDVYEVDFGQNIAGWTRLKISGEAGTEITMDHGTHSLVDGRPLQTEVYTLKGEGVEIWEPGFTYHGFRKVRVSGLEKAPEKDTFQARVVHTAFDERGGFKCSNPVLNRIVEMCRWSYVGNFVGIPTDCPHREKNGWSADAQVSAELGLSYYGSEAAYTRWMLDFQAVQAEDGKLPCIVPDGGLGWGTRFLDGPSWESAYLIIPWHIYEYRGDSRILEHHYENYKKWLSWYRDEDRVIKKPEGRFESESSHDCEFSKYKNPQNVNQDNIIYYGIGDWPPNGLTPFEITSTAHYYKSAQIISRIASLLGKRDEEKEYADLAAQVRKAFNREFYDPAAGTYSRGSHTGMSCALYFGFVEEDQRQRVADSLAEGLRKNDHQIEMIGFLGSRFLLHALAENNHVETAYKVITRKKSPGWGYLEDIGRTTISECIDGTASDNHVAHGDVAAWMMQYLAGIQLDKENPGFQKFFIKPQVVGDLTWVKSHHDSPYGRIESAWKIEDGKFKLDITVPPNSTATVFMPGEKKGKEVDSGKYSFKVNASHIDSTRDEVKQHGYQVNGEDKSSDQNDTADSRSHSATTRGSSGAGNMGGRVPMSWVFFSPRNKESEINVFTEKGSVTLESLDVYELNSIWDGGRDEIYRPQFHYSPKTGVMGDPHGLVYYDGEYHLFYQWEGPWGHAVSTDMIHWQQLPEALTPDAHAGGHSVYSGSCVVDYHNTAGFKTGENDVIVAIYTINNDGMESQALAYSNDRGRTFTAYAGNPVMATEYDKRDPKVFWYESDSKWVMALHNKFGVDFYSSPNLKDWTYMSRVEGFNECPDIFELSVDGDPKNTKWVLLDASNTGYRLGQFDGTAFIPETAGMPIDFGRNHYATQTFSNIPRSDGRTIQMAWMKSAHFPEMPFDQQQTFPSELSLRTCADGVRLCRAPIREIESIRGKHYQWSNEMLVDGGEDLLSGINHDLIEIIAVFDLTDATSPEFGFHLRDAVIYYYVAASQFTVWHDNISKTATLKPDNNKISMHILLDRTSMEVYAN